MQQQQQQQGEEEEEGSAGVVNAHGSFSRGLVCTLVCLCSPFSNSHCTCTLMAHLCARSNKDAILQHLKAGNARPTERFVQHLHQPRGNKAHARARVFVHACLCVGLWRLRGGETRTCTSEHVTGTRWRNTYHCLAFLAAKAGQHAIEVTNDNL